MAKNERVTVVLGEGCVTLRKSRRSRPIVANILGSERDADGSVRTIWLDRLVHGAQDHWEGEWEVTGAVSSILTRRAQASANADTVTTPTD
ncbi:MAG: hypothetical protein EOM91_22550 [Sphingobacteriia bacterium]|jgi:hypothetical protein|nr:hypothetical protein [Sphingobacteriia bacterium]